MRNLSIQSLTLIKDKIEQLLDSTPVTEDGCNMLLDFVKGIYEHIEENSFEYGSDATKMQNLCLMSEFFLEVRISSILEFNHRTKDYHQFSG